MNKTEVIALLEENKNDRGIQNWQEMEYDKCQYESYGIGLTVLRKLAKKVGKNHDLAMELWKSTNYDMKIISVLIDDPKKITREQMESQVEDVNFGMMVHVFSACGAPVAKTPFIVEVTDEWIRHKDNVRKRCGYGFLYETSKSYKKSAPDEQYLMDYIDYIDQHYPKLDKSVHMSMAAAIMGIGKRSLKLNQAALKLANKIGPIPVETGKTKCEPFDISKHLTSDYLMKKLKG